MGLFNLIKDIVLLPIDFALDITLITPISKVIRDDDSDTPFGTIERLKSIGNNLDETRD